MWLKYKKCKMYFCLLLFVKDAFSLKKETFDLISTIFMCLKVGSF